MKVVVTGIGLVSALGHLASTWDRLLNGESGIQDHQPFPDFPPRPLALIGQVPTTLEYLTPLAVADAVADAGLTLPLPDCGVVIGSSRGCQASWEEFAKQRINARAPDSLHPDSSPPNESGVGNLDHWLTTLPHYAAIATAAQIGSTIGVRSPMAACATGIWAIAQGFEFIQTGHCQQVLAGAVEAPVTPLTLAGFEKMGALAETGAYPFDQQRQGLVLGEGAAVLVLESADLALRRGVRIYGEVLGFGLTCDAYHISTPASRSESAIKAVKQGLNRSHLTPMEINYIHAHGTGTQLNDRHEAWLIESLFTQGVAVSSTKGATGHTLGASGAIGAAFSLMALHHGILPPCVGVREPEFNLDLVIQPRFTPIQRVLCFSFGFGGQNAVMVLGKVS